MTQESTFSHRPIRSFVIRQSRQTPAQRAALARLYPIHGVPWQADRLNLVQTFGRAAPVWLEIGFGNGEMLAHLARHNPQVNLLGVEVHPPGVGHALRLIEQHELTNIRIVQHDALEVMADMLGPDTLERVLLYFPDPWRKKRHHKRRIVQSDFIREVCTCLRPGGLLHCATDWEDYALWMLEHLNAAPGLCNLADDGGFSPRPEWRGTTRFEARGERLGHTVYDLLYEHQPPGASMVTRTEPVSPPPAPTSGGSDASG